MARDSDKAWDVRVADAIDDLTPRFSYDRPLVSFASAANAVERVACIVIVEQSSLDAAAKAMAIAALLVDRDVTVRRVAIVALGRIRCIHSVAALRNQLGWDAANKEYIERSLKRLIPLSCLSA